MHKPLKILMKIFFCWKKEPEFYFSKSGNLWVSFPSKCIPPPFHPPLPPPNDIMSLVTVGVWGGGGGRWFWGMGVGAS